MVSQDERGSARGADPQSDRLPILGESEHSDDGQGKRKIGISTEMNSLVGRIWFKTYPFLLNIYENHKYLLAFTVLAIIFVVHDNATSGTYTGGAFGGGGGAKGKNGYLGASIMASSSMSSTGLMLTNDPKLLLKRFQEAKNELFDKLGEDYGYENFEDMFFEPDRKSRGRTAFLSPSLGDISWNRLKEKMSVKVLQTMLGSADSQFVWATGGGSTAAGWGNFFYQSYTAVMERSAKDVFAAVGINLIAKNHALGNSAPSPEIALCSDAIFGTDFDLLAWDYGVEETVTAMDHFLYRAALGPNRPATIALMHEHSAAKIKALAELEVRGMTTIYLDYTKEKRMLELVPDTFHLTEQEMKDMPRLVKNFKCSNKVEAGEPHCADEKYDMHHCAARMFKSDNHPGWKWHALYGNLLALFLVEVLEDAVKEIVASPDPLIIQLMKLESSADRDHRRLLNSDLPVSAQDMKFTYPLPVRNEEDIRNMLFKEPCICHTALLPADTRYRGILLDSESVDPFKMESVEPVLHSGNMQARPNPGNDIRLIADETDRQRCPTTLNIDHRDFFYSDFTEGWKGITLPNDREMAAYRDGEPLKGYIAICYHRCHAEGQCPANQIIDGLQLRLLSLKVGVRPAVRMSGIAFQEFNSDCYLLMTNAGMKFNPDEDGRFRLEMRVEQPDSHLSISSFIIW